ncbi:hypothetical protein GCM10009765_52920 [Fodinicola feengrottensis]|uniref:Uncharacterized protein n=1 Tax=Fodinicola feengrottensis TaxID=435914 RepID=A0ABP4U480_9ACTN
MGRLTVYLSMTSILLNSGAGRRSILAAGSDLLVLGNRVETSKEMLRVAVGSVLLGSRHFVGAGGIRAQRAAVAQGVAAADGFGTGTGVSPTGSFLASDVPHPMSNG